MGDASGQGGATLRFTAPGSAYRNDLFIMMGAFVTPRVKTLKVPRDSEIEAARPDLAEMMVCLMRPVSRGELKLRSTDPDVQPWLDYNYLSEPFDRQRLRHGVRQALQLGRHEGLGELLGDRLEPADPRPGLGGGARCLDVAGSSDLFPHIGHLQDGAVIRPDGRGRPVRAGARDGGSAGGGCIHNAGSGDRAHQPGRPDDRRKDRRFSAPGLLILRRRQGAAKTQTNLSPNQGKRAFRYNARVNLIVKIL